MPTPAASQHVEITEGYADGPVDYSPRHRVVDGRAMIEPVMVSNHGTVRFDVDRPVRLELLARRRGRYRQGFTPLRTITGGLPRERSNEIRLLPERLDRPWTLAVGDLHSPFNEYPLDDGDLLLAELITDEGERSTYLFRTRRLGLRVDVGGGVLLSLPLATSSPSASSPVVAGSLSFKYHFRSAQPTARWVGENVGAVVSVGARPAIYAQGGPLGGGIVDRGLDAGVVGGGLQLFDVVSVQVLASTAGWGPQTSARPTTLAVGFDAVQFARRTRQATRRLFRNNVLETESTW